MMYWFDIPCTHCKALHGFRFEFGTYGHEVGRTQNVEFWLKMLKRKVLYQWTEKNLLWLPFFNHGRFIDYAHNSFAWNTF